MNLGLMLSPMATAQTTRHLASAFHAHAPSGITVTELPLAAVPLQPPYEDMPIPTAGTAWKQQVSAVDGLVVVVRARTRSVPGHLKIGIDWASQPEPINVLRGKACLVVAVGEGARPSFLALQHARTVLSDAGANVQKRPDYSLVLNADSFAADGSVADVALTETIVDILDSACGFSSHQNRIASLELPEVVPLSPVRLTATPGPVGPVL